MASDDHFVLTHHENDRRLRLEGWRQNVGALVALDAAPAAPSESAAASRSVIVLSWNVWVGHGRLREVVSRIRNGDFAEQGAEPDAPLVVLAQEVFRHDPGMTSSSLKHSGRTSVSKAGQQREDIVEAAHTLGMNLRYAPSMRNGAMQSDRGNAILSTLPLVEAQAVELPHVLQRRVAVTAAVRVGDRKLTFASAHLDARGRAGHQWLGTGGRALQAQHLLTVLEHETVILGADLNVAGGRYEGAFRLLRDAGFTMGVPEMAPKWPHTYHALPRLVLDYLLVRDPAGAIARAPVHRLDEHPEDRGPFVFGSDHHPLFARVDLASE